MRFLAKGFEKIREGVKLHHLIKNMLNGIRRAGKKFEHKKKLLY
jgi:hypothetical protein